MDSPADDEDLRLTGLEIFIGPFSTVRTSIGKVYLYDLRSSDCTFFEKLPVQSSEAKFKQLLPVVASLSVTKHLGQPRIDLAPEDIAKLTDADFQLLIDAFVKAPSFAKTSEDDSLVPSERTAKEGESTADFLVRLIEQSIAAEKAKVRALVEKLEDPTRRLIDEARKSTSAITDSLKGYSDLRAQFDTPVAPTFPRISESISKVNQQVFESAQRAQRDRQEELSLTRRTADMTATSAKALRDLTIAATDMLERTRTRDEADRKTTSMQIWIAVFSLVASLVLSVASLVYSVREDNRERADNGADVIWQKAILEDLKLSTARDQSLADENAKLTKSLQELERRVQALTSKAEASTQQSGKPPSRQR